jgi:hypothetical protein
VFVVHEVVAQAGAATCDAAIGECYVETAQEVWNMENEEAVEEADGCVSIAVSIVTMVDRGHIT